MLIIKVSIFFSAVLSVAAWSAILLDGANDVAQMFAVVFVPGSEPTANISFDLPHLLGAAAVMLNGRAFFIGGLHRNNTVSNHTIIFDPVTNTSTAGPQLNIERYNHAATVVDDTIIVCGGNSQEDFEASCEQYTGQSWHRIAPLPLPNNSPVMVTLHGRAYVLGGAVAQMHEPTDECCTYRFVYMYDNDKWLERAPMPVGRRHHAGVALDDDTAVVCGGIGYIPDRGCYDMSDCHIYTASTNMWSSAPPMLQKRNQAYIVDSGYNSSVKGSVEVYSPISGSKYLLPSSYGIFAMSVVAVVDDVIAANRRHKFVIDNVLD